MLPGVSLAHSFWTLFANADVAPRKQAAASGSGRERHGVHAGGRMESTSRVSAPTRSAASDVVVDHALGTVMAARDGAFGGDVAAWTWAPYRSSLARVVPEVWRWPP